MMYIKPNELLSADICHHVSINNHKRMLIIGDLDGSLKELQNALNRGADSVVLLEYLKE
jgi:hypothetical protein